MEFETYEEVIDSYNSGVGVEAGETLTDYIKRNNIKIKEIQMDPIGDFEKILKGSRPMEKEGIMQMASYEPASYDPALIEAYEQYKYDMNEQRPGMPIIDIDEFIRMELGPQPEARRIDPPIEEIVREFIRVYKRKPNSLEELKEFFEMRMGTAQKPEMKMVAEGYIATKKAYLLNLDSKKKAKTPIIDAAYKILYEKRSAKKIFKDLSDIIS